MNLFTFLGQSNGDKGFWAFQNDAGRKYLKWVAAFWFAVALLELGQDIVSSMLNGNPFWPRESLPYKLFWLLFIPFTPAVLFVVGMVKSLKKTGVRLPFYVLLVAIFSLLHLVLFAFMLFGISNLDGEIGWQLPGLLVEKFSTRLYIVLGVYAIMVWGFIRSAGKKKREAENAKTQIYADTIPVKNGRKTKIVNVKSIYWIGSDGAYLVLHTAEKKHLVKGSLKNIITGLPDHFKRIHRSTIVNAKMIGELKSRLNGDYDVILKNGETLRLSRNYSDNLKGTLL